MKATKRKSNENIPKVNHWYPLYHFHFHFITLIFLIMSNFSCYIKIVNQSSQPLLNADVQCSYGAYKSRPKTNLNPGDSTSFRLADKSGPAGSTGIVTYDVGLQSISFSYDCPYDGGSSNKLSFTNSSGLIIELFGSNDDSYLNSIPAGHEGQYPSDGHPLSGIFIVKDGEPVTPEEGI